jgi:hypothetical protein
VTHGTDSRTRGTVSYTATLHADIPSELLRSPHVHLIALSDCIIVPTDNCKQGSTQLSAGTSLESKKANRSRGDIDHRRMADPDRQATNVQRKDRFFYTETERVGEVLPLVTLNYFCVLWLGAENPILNRYEQKGT